MNNQSQRKKLAIQPRELTVLEKDALDWLYATKWVEPFMKSLRLQLIEWCNARENRKSNAPLSPKQFNCLLDNYERYLRSEVYQTRISERRRVLLEPSLN